MFPNSAKGGDTLTLSIEGFASVREAKAFVDAKCTIEVYEIDEPKRKTGVDPGDDLLAKFEATIVKEAGESPPRYSFKDLARTDAFPDTLPGPERNRKVTDDTGADWPLSYEPTWKPPHFLLAMPTPPGEPSPSGLHTVLIRGHKSERERYIYEIAFRVKIGGSEKFTSRRNPTRLDCNNLLAHNCAEAAIMMMKDHQELVRARGVGTHCGSEFKITDDDQHTYSRESDLDDDKAKYSVKSSSCIVYLLDAIELGHEKTAAQSDWISIKRFMKDGKGILLAKGLQEWKWVGLYFSPDTKHPRDIDWSPTKWRRNHHKDTYRQARGRGGGKENTRA